MARNPEPKPSFFKVLVATSLPDWKQQGGESSSGLYSVTHTMDGGEESIEAMAAARREWLRALKLAQELLNTPDDNPENDNNQQQQEEEAGRARARARIINHGWDMKFRNYLPHDKQLQEGKLAPPVLPKFEDPVLVEPPPEEKKEDPFLNIAPEKPNWDWRRDVQKKLEKLERRTQKAMVTLMEQEESKRRLKEDGGETGIQD